MNRILHEEKVVVDAKGSDMVVNVGNFTVHVFFCISGAQFGTSSRIKTACRDLETLAYRQF